MEYEEVVSGLDALTKKGMDFGVERTRALLDKLGCPDKKLKIIHIAGTNGKGSVAEYMTEILLAAGKRTGAFTSPAVYDYFEQFKINGKNIDRELFTWAFGAALKAGEGATHFEVETAGALYAFALANCEYAVIECGLGGRYDATNAVSKKEVALITSISLEHTAILGNTLNSICGHKSGIIKDCPAVISGLNPQEVLDYFGNLGARVAGKYDAAPLNGEAQKYNCAVAIEGARILGIDENAVYSGVKRAKSGARLEVFERGGNVYVLDGAHNPAAFSCLAQFIRQKYGKADFIVLGSLSDKDIFSNVSEIKDLTDKVIAVKPDSPRAMAAEKVVEACEMCGVCAEKADGVDKALERARGIVAVCGTFTILREAKLWIEKRQ